MFRASAFLVACVTLTRALGAQGAGTTAGAPFRVGWHDGAALAAGGALGVLPIALHLPSGSAPCAPCDPGSLSALDAIAVHRYDATADRASTLLLLGAGGAAGFASIWGQDRREAIGNAIVFADAITWSTVADQWLKVGVHRSRPVLYTSAAPEAANIRDNRESFPSGHAELAFAAATAYLMIARRRGLPHTTRNAVILYTVASVVGVLRVAAAKHFPTDVVAGAALGSAVSWAVVKLHP